MNQLKTYGLTESKLLEAIGEHLGTEMDAIKVEVLEAMGGNNDNFMSNIGKLKVKAFKEDSQGVASVKTVDLVVKFDIPGIIQKLMQAFCHETLWYEYLQPSLAKEYPEIQMISPPCMFASSDKLNLKRPLEKAFGVLGAYGRMFGQEERGVLVMENVTLQRTACSDSQRMERRDKSEMVSMDEASTVLETLARYHGINWLFYRGHCQTAITNKDKSMVLEREEILSYLVLKHNKVTIQSIKNEAIKNTNNIVPMVRNLLVTDPEILVAKIQRYAKERSAEDSLKLWDWRSEFYTLGHGDLWSNNLLFSPDRKRVMLIDFQGMDGRHMALDFWYFLYTSTDSQWRKANLAKCYDAYYSILRGYLAPHWPDFTLEKLKTEFEGCRIIAGVLWGASFNLPTTMSPYHLDGIENERMGIMSKKMHEKKKRELGSTPAESDHPMIKEMRRRVLDAWVEASDLGLV